MTAEAPTHGTPAAHAAAARWRAAADVPAPAPADAAELAGKRVIIILPGFMLGGAQRQGIALARYLRHECGANAVVWSMPPDGRGTELCREYGVPSRVIPSPWEWHEGKVRKALRLLRFAWQLRRARPDVLMPYCTVPNVLTGLVWRLTGARLCVWSQEDVGLGWPFPRGDVAARRTPLFISNSAVGADWVVNTLGIERRRVRVILNGIDLAPPRKDRAAWRRDLGVAENVFVAVMVANLSMYKDHATLLRAWRIVLDRTGDSRDGAPAAPPVLLLAGQFMEGYESVRDLAAELKLGHAVRFLGVVKDVGGLLHSADLAVLSSHSEGVPNGVLEPMASGLPVIGSDVDGIREALGPEAAELLTPPGDAEALAGRILEMASDPARRAAVGARLFERAKTAFGFADRMGRETAEFLITGLREAAAGDSPGGAATR